MKNLYSLVLVAIATLTGHAQLTQSNHALAAADTYTNYQYDSLGISDGANGANATWNFNAAKIHTAIPVTFAAAGSTNTSYAAATVSVSCAPYGNTYFYNSTSSLLNFYGGKVSVGPVSAVLNYTQPAVYAAYPMSLNSTTNSAISGSVNVVTPLATTGTFTGACTVSVTGSGTLTIGTGTANTYTNVLKVMTSQTMELSTGVGGATLTQTSYDYYSSGIKAPIFSILSATAITGLGTNTQTLVNSIKSAPVTTTTPPPTSFVTVPDNSANAISINVFPNPAGAYVNFTSDNDNAYQVAVYDITGKLVDKQILIDGKLKLNTSDYQAGLYIYNVNSRTNQRLKTGKLTISH